MAFKLTEPLPGAQKITVGDETQNHPLGKIVQAKDDTLGEGEFIYLKNSATLIVGALVTFDPVNNTTTLSPNTANLTNPFGVAMAALTTSQYGWFQISGAAVIKKSAVTVSPGVALYLSATTGRVRSSAASGKQISGCKSVNAATVAAATSTVQALISRPCGQGQVI